MKKKTSKSNEDQFWTAFYEAEEEALRMPSDEELEKMSLAEIREKAELFHRQGKAALEHAKALEQFDSLSEEERGWVVKNHIPTTLQTAESHELSPWLRAEKASRFLDMSLIEFWKKINEDPRAPKSRELERVHFWDKSELLEWVGRDTANKIRSAQAFLVRHGHIERKITNA